MTRPPPAPRAQQLYNALLALPAMPPGIYNCPVDWGALYHLRFYDDAAQLVATAVVDPNGCEIATLPDGSKRWAATDPGFWPAFAAAFGVPQSAISPFPQQSGPSAPATLPN